MSISFVNGDKEIFVDSIKMYSDGTPMVKHERWDEIVASGTMVTVVSDLQEFIVAMAMATSVRSAGGRISTLILPYLPGARQDRINPTGDILFTSRFVADLINAQGFDKVVSVDPHSPTMPSMIENFVEYPLENVAMDLWPGYTGIIAPDEGARGRAHRVSLIMGKPVYYGSKVRDVSNGRLTGFDVEPLPKGGHFLVVDDICDGGGTFVGLGEKIREQGAYADLFVTHGIFSKGLDDLAKYYKTIYTTDSRRFDGHNGLLCIEVLNNMKRY